ncbi:Starch-binding domain-containing protein 1 [Myotis davidii]|uniref:Starch-binding domain-containing protein 1 n=1 Tax=Myotis davidii TaxID=225400 RepID=L5MFI8_MYODS|nr:Starch-binding domain-containing protein 1 [Myotis davidii]
MGAVWSALLVGGGLAGALFIWLLRDKGKKGDAEREKDAALGKAASAGGDQSSGSGLSPGPSRREPITKPGAVPSSPRLQGSAKGSEIRREEHAHLEHSFPGTNFPTRARTLPAPSSSQAGAHAPHRFLAFSRSPGDALAVPPRTAPRLASVPRDRP